MFDSRDTLNVFNCINNNHNYYYSYNYHHHYNTSLQHFVEYSYTPHVSQK